MSFPSSFRKEKSAQARGRRAAQGPGIQNVLPEDLNTSWNFREEEFLGRKIMQTLLKSGRARVLDRKARDQSVLDEEGKRIRSTVGTD